jgi:hypothetical protein
MSTRLEEYKRRVEFKGKNKREYVNKKVEESIQSLIYDSQYGFSIDIYDKTNKTYSTHDVAILSTKTTQEYEAANIIAPLGLGLEKGTIFRWNEQNWIVLKSMFRPEQPGFNGIAYRCTGELKWIDDDGVLHIQPAYIRSGRITNALGVTPDVNRVFDNIVMHDTDWNMMAATQQPNPLPLLHPEMRFIIKGQSYRVTNVDNVSIDNVSILSLVDDKALDTDDLINDIAYSDEYEYVIQNDLGKDVKLYAGDVMELPVRVLRDGIKVNEEYTLVSSDNSIVEVNGNKLIGRGLGTATVTATLNRNKTIAVDIEIIVSEQHNLQTSQLFIEGSDYIEWNSGENGENDYFFSTREPGQFTYEVQSKIRVTSEDIKNDNDDIIGIRLIVKDKYAGKIKIKGITETQEVEKIVYIRTV